MPDFRIDWDAIARMEPMERERAAAALLNEVPGVQERLARIRSAAAVELRERHGSTPAAEMMGISRARLGQIIGDDGREDGIRLGLIKRGVILAQRHGGALEAGDDAKLALALGALARRGRRSTVEATGIATRLVTIRTSALDWDSMPPEDQEELKRALAHAFEVMRHEQPRPSRPASRARRG